MAKLLEGTVLCPYSGDGRVFKLSDCLRFALVSAVDKQRVPVF
jgi:hypothetical protein